MPTQHTFLGHPVHLRAPPRRFQVLGGFLALFCFALILFGPPTRVDHVPTREEIKEKVEDIKDTVTHPKVPDRLNPFAPSVHKPPIQDNTTSGSISWYNNWKWRNPFSSTITLDENRAVLPPLNTRYPVYTFYDDGAKKDERVKKAENELLLIWRRAWWAQGFKPVVLSRAEAMQNPLYETIQRIQLDQELETDIVRWLAWGTMGTGILANWLTLPMAAYDDAVLSYLRRGEYPQGLGKFKGLESALFYGEKEAINSAIKESLIKDISKVKEAKSMLDLLNPKAITTEDPASAIAWYSRAAIKSKYQTISDKLFPSNASTTADGLTALGLLINAHLHNTWQNTFSSGIAVLKPLPEHTTHLVEAAVDIARNLTQCPTSPSPQSCPPNKPKCSPCQTSHHHDLVFLPHYRNSSTTFTIGTVPHPYTMTSLRYQLDVIDARFLRRDAERDAWIYEVTKELLGAAVSGANRVVRFKESVAGIHGMSHSLWLTAERESHQDLDWIFGFKIPREEVDSKIGTSTSKTRPPPPESDTLPNEEALVKEMNLLDKARKAIKSEKKDDVRIRMEVEEWNLADTEAWRFARAFSARRRVERLQWEQEETKFAGAESRNREQGGLGRWLDF
jgi:hypothetical protein